MGRAPLARRERRFPRLLGRDRFNAGCRPLIAELPKDPEPAVHVIAAGDG